MLCSPFFFDGMATSEIYTLSLHDALPICGGLAEGLDHALARARALLGRPVTASSRGHADAHRSLARAFREDFDADRKSTRLNSSHGYISYAVFCLKKKNNNATEPSHCTNS